MLPPLKDAIQEVRDFLASPLALDYALGRRKIGEDAIRMVLQRAVDEHDEQSYYAEMTGVARSLGFVNIRSALGGLERRMKSAAAQPNTPTPAALLHDATLALATELASKDPAADTPEGQILQKLAAAVEAYEIAVFPIAASAVPVPPAEPATELLRASQAMLNFASPPYEKRKDLAVRIGSFLAAMPPAEGGKEQ